MRSIASVCVCVAGSVQLVQLLKALNDLKLHFWVQAHLENIWVKFICHDHWVKVKVKRDIRA